MTTSGTQKPLRSNPGNLLHTKLMPPHLHITAIQRPDLLKLLDTSLGKKLILVTAPTGYGKSTLVSMWIASRSIPSAWVTLDENDNDPARFWTYVCSGLRALDKSLGKSSLSALAAPQPSAYQTLLLPLINDLGRLAETCVLVLDEYHAISSTQIKDGLAFLIQHLPDTLRLVLISRTEPSLPLGILRARGEMAEVTVADLRFNQAETRAFLQDSLAADLSPAMVARLHERTEGWAAGLRLASLSLQNKNAAEIEAFLSAFSGSHRYVADYLLREVFETQPEPVQNFLLKTCFLNRLTASLCDAVTGAKNGAEVLEQLERNNLFIVQLERGGHQIWYRYNSLFAESIQYFARQRLDEIAIQAIFESASRWYEYHGRIDEAIETAFEANLFERAMDLIEKYIEIHDISELLTLGRWLERVPQAQILQRPAICLAYAQVILYSADRFAPATANRIDPFLRSAESAWRAQGNHQKLGQVLSFRGTVTWWQGDFAKAFDYARQALEELPEHDVLWRGNSLLIASYAAINAGRILEAQDKVLEARALLGAAQNIYGVLAATQMLSEVFYWQGELEQAEQLNQQILVDAVGDESMLDDQGIASVGLAHIAYERNELLEAEQFAQRALDLGKQRANESLQVQAAIRLAHIVAAGGDPGQARGLVKELEGTIQNPALLRDIQNAQAFFSIWANNGLSLDWWVTIISVEDQNALHLQKEHETFLLARLRIREGKITEALKMLQDWKADAVNNGRTRSQVEALCLEALAYQASSNGSQAAQSLTEALRIGQARGFRRIFLDEGTPMAALIQASLPRLPNRTLSLYAATLLHSFLPEASSQPTSASSWLQVEALSQQELRVLRLLVAGLSNQDIARELVVSTNTIKTHVKNIYRKLDVTSRDEAREVARELKLLH